MKLLNLKARGFLSIYEETNFPLDQMSFVAISGANGNGKSTIFHAIQYCLFGSVRVRGNIDSVVNDFSEDAAVRLTLQGVDGGYYRITRRRHEFSETKLIVEERTDDNWDSDDGWVQKGDHTIKTSQALIQNEILNMSHNIFASLAYVSQESSYGTEFLRTEPEHRHEMLMAMIPEMYPWYGIHQTASDLLYDINSEIKMSSERIKSLDEDVEELESQLKEVEDELSELRYDKTERYESRIAKLRDERAEVLNTIESENSDVQELKTKLKLLKAERDSRNADIRSEQSAVNSQISKINDFQRRVDQGEDRIKDEEQKVESHEALILQLQDTIEELSVTLDKHDSRMSSIKSNISHTNDILVAKNARLNDLKDRREALHKQLESDHATCIVCESALSPEKAEQIEESVVNEIGDLNNDISDIREELSDYRRQQERLQSKIDTDRRSLKNAETSLDRTNSDIERSSMTIGGLRSDIKALEDEIDKMPSISSLKAKLKTLVEEPESDLESDLKSQIDGTMREHDMSGSLRKVEDRIESLESEMKRFNSLNAKADSLDQQIVTSEKRHDKLHKRLEQLRTKKADVEILKNSSSHKGVPAALLSSTLEQIETYQNAILSRITSEKMTQVEYRTERAAKTKGANAKSVLDVVVHTTSGHERLFESYSGGERVRITLSNLLAMIQVFNERNTFKIRNLFMDEPFKEIDRQSIPMAISIIEDAISNGILDSVMIVTHEQEVIEALPQNIYVEPGTGAIPSPVYRMELS